MEGIWSRVGFDRSKVMMVGREGGRRKGSGEVARKTVTGVCKGEAGTCLREEESKNPSLRTRSCS